MIQVEGFLLNIILILKEKNKLKFFGYLSFFCLAYCQIDTVITVDASSYYDWVYFSLRTAEVVEVENPENSLDWDIAFQRKHIKTNSGLSGVGAGGAIVDSSMTWIEQWDVLNEIPEEQNWLVDETLNDFYNPITHLFGEGVKNAALNSWGWFDDNYTLNVTHYVLHVLSADGEDIFKFWPYSYYNTNGSGGNVSFRYSGSFDFYNQCNSDIGDVNQDGIINVVDLVSMVSYIIGSEDYNDCQISLSDYNFDNIVNVVDVVAIVNYILR